MARISLLHDSCLQALNLLADPHLGIVLPLVQGKAPGIRDLQIAHFPPKGIHPDNVSIGFTFEMLKGCPFKIEMMPNLVSNCDGDVTVVGFWSHSQAHGNENRDIVGIDPHGAVPTNEKFFVVNYRLSGKLGTIVMMRSLYAAIESHLRA